MKTRHLFVALAVSTLSACESSEGPNYVTWPIGLHVTGGGTAQMDKKSYKQSNFGSPVEQTGTIADGAYAGKSNGTFHQVKTRKFTDDRLVIGETRSNNPIVPGWDAYGDVPVFLVEETKNVTEEVTDTVEDRLEVQAGSLFGVHSENTAYSGPYQSAYSYGIAGDEYVVMISDLGLLWDSTWEVWERFWRGDDKLECCGALDSAGAYDSWAAGFEYLVKADPSKGDTWVDPNGGTFYRVLGKEDVNIGGKNFSAVKIEMRSVSPVDSNDVANRCLKVLDDKDSAQNLSGVPTPGVDHQYTIKKVYLDPSCAAGNFVHHRVGYQWWYKNVMVKAETTNYVVDITDYGFEYVFQTDPYDPSTTQWKTTDQILVDPSRAMDPEYQAMLQAVPFVQFDYTVETLSYQADGWEVLDFDGVTSSID